MSGATRKSYRCAIENCNLTFADEDALLSHQRLHGVQITVARSSSSQNKQNTSTTSTRHGKQYEELTFYPDVHLNPFDLEFRKASQTKPPFKSLLVVPEGNSSLNGSLETPRILPPVDSDETISSTSRDEAQVPISPSSSISSLSSVVRTPVTASSGLEDKACVSSSQVMPSRNSESENERREGRKKLTLNVSASDRQSDSSVMSTPTPVITAGPSASHSPLGLGNVVSPILNSPSILTANIPQITINGTDLSDLNTPGLSPTLRLFAASPGGGLSNLTPTVSAVQDLPPSENAPSVIGPSVVVEQTVKQPTADQVAQDVPSSPSATVLQLLLKLPDGQSIPVEIPATPLVTSATIGRPTQLSSSTVVSSLPSVSSQPASVTHKSSLAKLKLKEALASSQTAARPGTTKNSRASTADRIAEMTRFVGSVDPRQLGQVEIPEECKSVVDLDNTGIRMSFDASSDKSKGAKRRRRPSTPDEGPEEKRKKFLERNRVAAVRCREKKKRQVELMKRKSETVGMMNQRLIGEVTALKAEIASLKCLLLKHKDCSVTRALQAEQRAKEERLSGGGFGLKQNTSFVINDQIPFSQTQTICLPLPSDQTLTFVSANNKNLSMKQTVPITPKPGPGTALRVPIQGTTTLLASEDIARVSSTDMDAKVFLHPSSFPSSSFPVRPSSVPSSIVAIQNLPENAVYVRPSVAPRKGASTSSTSLKHNLTQDSIIFSREIPNSMSIPVRPGGVSAPKYLISVPFQTQVKIESSGASQNQGRSSTTTTTTLAPR